MCVKEGSTNPDEDAPRSDSTARVCVHRAHCAAAQSNNNFGRRAT